ncbi:MULTISPECIES: hypothetical protein [unclassified Microcoleus]
MPVPQKRNFVVVEQAEKPVQKRLIDNTARAELKPTRQEFSF